MIFPVIFAFIIGFYPFLWMLYYSFFNYDFGKPVIFTGMENYVRLLNDDAFAKSIYLSVVYTLSSLITEIALGTLLAYFLYKINRQVSSIFTMLLILPMVVTPAVSGIIWALLFDPMFGHVNYYLGLIGIQGPNWLVRAWSAMIAVIITDIWQWTPFVILVLFAGLTAIPPEPIEAAYIDGASELRTLIHILIPYLKPLFIICVFFRAIDCFKAFDFIYTMTGGGPGTSTSTLPLLLYLQVFSFYHAGYGSAIGTILWAILLVSTNLAMRKVAPILMGV